MVMNIAVIGLGGVGGYFGGKLTQLLKNDPSLNVFFIARNEHLKKIKEKGLILETEEEILTCIPTLATDNPDELPILDFILLCVKGFDLQNAINSISNKITDNTIILPLLNGVDVYDRVKNMVPRAIVLPSCVYIGTHIEEPGKVKQNGGACTIHFGNDPQSSKNIDNVIDLLTKASIKYNFTIEAEKEIWSKFIFIASFGLITANYNKTIGEVLENPDMKQQVNEIMNEIYALSKEKKVCLHNSIVKESIEKGYKFSYETKTSFQRDYEKKGNKDEREIFGGAILKLGEEYGIETPVTKLIYESIERKKIFA